MQVALLGYGYWGKIIEKYIINSGFFELKYIYCNEEIDDKKQVNEIDTILNDNVIEAVFICTPIDTHFDLCYKFLNNEKHVFCEKPSTKSLKEFDILYQIALKNNKVLFTDYIYTVSPSLQYISENFYLIGKLDYINGSIEQLGNFYQNDDVYEVLMVHLISSVLHVTKEHIFDIKFVDRYNGNKCMVGEASFSLESGCKVHLYASLINSNKVRKLNFYGNKGLIEFSLNTKPNVKVIQYDKIDNRIEVFQTTEKEFDENNGLALVIDKFYNHIITDNIISNLKLSKEVLEFLDKRTEDKSGENKGC